MNYSFQSKFSTHWKKRSTFLHCFTTMHAMPCIWIVSGRWTRYAQDTAGDFTSTGHFRSGVRHNSAGEAMKKMNIFIHQWENYTQNDTCSLGLKPAVTLGYNTVCAWTSNCYRARINNTYSSVVANVNNKSTVLFHDVHQHQNYCQHIINQSYDTKHQLWDHVQRWEQVQHNYQHKYEEV